MDNKKIGALWKKRSQKGMDFMSGVIEIDNKKIFIVVFKNEKKTDKQPDYSILLSQPMGERPPQTEQEEQVQAQPTQQDQEVTIEDLPF